MSIKEPPLEDKDIDWYVNEGLQDMNDRYDNYMDEDGRIIKNRYENHNYFFDEN